MLGGSIIDETLVRLDDILSRTFQFSPRIRRGSSKENSPTQQHEESFEHNEVTFSESRGEKTDLNGSNNSASAASSQLLIPLGTSVPESPQREEYTNAGVDNATGNLAVSGMLEEGLNESAVQVLDGSFRSASGQLLSHDFAAPKVMLDSSSDVHSSDDAANDDIMRQKSQVSIDVKHAEMMVETPVDDHMPVDLPSESLLAVESSEGRLANASAVPAQDPNPSKDCESEDTIQDEDGLVSAEQTVLDPFVTIPSLSTSQIRAVDLNKALSWLQNVVDGVDEISLGASAISAHVPVHQEATEEELLPERSYSTDIGEDPFRDSSSDIDMVESRLDITDMDQELDDGSFHSVHSS
jgi:hypothetical protein